MKNTQIKQNSKNSREWAVGNYLFYMPLREVEHALSLARDRYERAGTGVPKLSIKSSFRI